MKDDKYFFDFKLQPGKKLNNTTTIYNQEQKPLVSIITSYYNSDEFMWQTINCVLNQTFPYWEWIIVDDGSTKKESIEYLKNIEKIDKRIKVYHKQNEGLAKGRDYAIQFSNTRYVLPLDADDLIEPTYIETLYWSLETNPDATWAFTNSLGFGKYIYLVDKDFDCEQMKTNNMITATALIRKEKILELNGYGVAKRYVNEDWHLWLRMLANGEYPVQIPFYGFWYRRRKESLLSQINNEENKENELRLKDIKVEADKIEEKVNAIIYPDNTESKTESKILENAEKLLMTNNRKKCLFILPQTGPDKKMFENVKNLSKEYDIYIITLENDRYSPYIYRQKYEKFATVFDLTTFLNKEYFIGFIEYIIATRQIKDVYITKELTWYTKLKKLLKNTNDVSYKASNNVYNSKIIKYKLCHTIIGRATRKIIRIICKERI